MRIGLCQLQVTDDKRVNLRQAQSLITKAVDDGAQLIMLPEMFNCPYDINEFAQYAETYPHGQTYQFLSNMASQYNILLIGGSIPEKRGDKLYNSSFVFGPDGQLQASYSKMHLFDVNLEDVSFQESAVLTPGKDICLFTWKELTIGLAICYDLRFPELFYQMSIQGAQLICVPGNFNMVSGPAHWELLFRCRAVDNQVFMLGASAATTKDGNYVSYGHSLAVDPWGCVLVQADGAQGVITADLDWEKMNDIRHRLPLLHHRRLEVFK